MWRKTMQTIVCGQVQPRVRKECSGIYFTSVQLTNMRKGSILKWKNFKLSIVDFLINNRLLDVIQLEVAKNSLDNFIVLPLHCAQLWSMMLLSLKTSRGKYFDLHNTSSFPISHITFSHSPTRP